MTAHGILAPSGKHSPDISEHSGAAEGALYISGSFSMQGVQTGRGKMHKNGFRRIKHKDLG